MNVETIVFIPFVHVRTSGEETNVKPLSCMTNEQDKP